MEINEFGLYNITIKIKNVNDTDTICVFGIKNCILYYGEINKSNNIILFNYSHNIYTKKKSIIFDKNTISKKIYICVIGNKIYDYDILKYEKIIDTQKLIILGDSHSYTHGEIDKYFSWSQYFPYILNKNIEIINLSVSGRGGIPYYNDEDRKIYISNFIDKQTIIFSIFGAIDEKRVKELNQLSFDEYQIEINDFFKYLSKYTNNIYFCKMYPCQSSDNSKQIVTRANDFEYIYNSINNIICFNIDKEVLNEKNYINGFSLINETHTGILGGIIIGNILRNKLKSFGLNIFNDKNLYNDITILILKNIEKIFSDNYQLIKNEIYNIDIDYID